MPVRRRGARASTRAQVQKTPTPQASDSEMPDAPSEAATPVEVADRDGEDDAEDEGADEDGEEAGADEEEEEEEDAIPIASSPVRGSRTRAGRSSYATPPVRRRPGRPPKYASARHLDASDREASDATPRRRGGFRGGRGFGGGRWKNKNLQRQAALPVDKDGNTVEIENDEAVLPDYPEGETKIDRDGHLLGGREYRVRTFTVEGKGSRLYMLSTEPARCIGFRDSYLFFQKHKMLYKILLTDDEKLDLIERNLMPHSYKGRTIGVVTARSVFREFGAKIVIAGKKIVDDYRVADVRAEGETEGELAVPEDRLPGPGEEYNRNQYVAWHGASAVYHSNVPNLPMMQGGKVEPKKRKVTVTGANWMLEHAREASRFNQALTHARRLNNAGVYEPYTNLMHYPKIMQPTHARWEQVDEENGAGADASPQLTNGASLTNGISTTSDSPLSVFPSPSSRLLRNFATVDTTFLSAPSSAFPAPGPDAAASLLLGESPGLASVSEELVDALSEDCRTAFLKERAAEKKWTTGWGTEGRDGLRGEVRVGYNGV